MQASDILVKGRFTPTQLELLKFFATEPTEQELKDIRQFFIQYLAEKALNSVEEAIQTKEYSKKEIENWSTSHNRTPYESYRQFLANKK